MDNRDKGFLGEIHPFMKLLLLGFIIFFTFLIIMLIGSLVAIPFFDEGWLESFMHGFDFSHPDNLNVLRYIQILSHIGLFIVPSLIYAWLVGGRIDSFLLMNNRANNSLLGLSALVIIAAIPLINFFIELNMRMSLPESLKALEEWMLQSEESAMELTEMFLNVTTVQGYLFNIFMIAIIPALGEEFMFRGIVLRIFGQWSKNTHVAVWVSALLFSAMHMQFYGFLPRLFLGLLLGYLFVWGKNIWLPVLAHFVNNALAVTLYFLIHAGYVNVDYDELGKETVGVVYVILSIVSVSVIFWYFYQNSRQKGSSG